jgi:hypothetical protein
VTDAERERERLARALAGQGLAADEAADLLPDVQRLVAWAPEPPQPDQTGVTYGFPSGRTVTRCARAWPSSRSTSLGGIRARGGATSGSGTPRSLTGT